MENKNYFAHLKVHSEYSFLESCCRINQLVDACQDNKMDAIALTDKGNLCGVLNFFRATQKKNIKPIIGLSLRVSEKSCTIKEVSNKRTTRMTVLAKNNKGYRNLIKLATLGYEKGFYYFPRVDLKILSENSEGLIFISDFYNGVISQNIIDNQTDRVEETVSQLTQMVPKEDIYFEIQNHGIESRVKLLHEIAKLSKSIGIKLVATNDVFYMKQEDSFSHSVLMCLKAGVTLSKMSQVSLPCDQFYFKSTLEMKSALEQYPEAIDCTKEIVDKCSVDINFNERRMPKFNVEQTEEETKIFLKEECLTQLKKKYPEKKHKEAEERLEFELKVICDMGFADYFLIVSDFVRYAKEQGISVGPGRGSAAGSIVSYVLGITTIEPLQFGLLFERFLNPSRISMPDIDIDFCKQRRSEVIQYVAQRYGRRQVAQIMTFGTMAAKMVLRDVGRVLDISLKEVDILAKKIPSDPKMTLTKAIEQEESLAHQAQGTYKDLFEVAMKLEGLTRQPGVHAAGIIIGAEDLTNTTPLYYNKGEDTDVSTQFEANDLESLGLLKMDFLGLRTLTIIDTAIENIKKRDGKTIDINEISMEDQKTFDLLSRGDTVGVFQLESAGMRDLAQRMGVDKFEVIVALLALYRPGPLEWAGEFIKRKKDPSIIKYDHPKMESILSETFGIMLYQEQVMKVVNELAGFSLADADLLRRAMGKKKTDVMDAQREKFVIGCREKIHIESDLSNRIFDNIAKFAGYGFNKSHSVAYSFISYQTAYLKANYLEEFMASILTHTVDNPDKLLSYIDECKNQKIPILAPSVNESDQMFTVTDKGIRFGLNAVKNVGIPAIHSIIEEREKGPYKDLRDFCMRVDLKHVNKRVIESLIKAAALDISQQKRDNMFHCIEQYINESNKKKKDEEAGQQDLFDVTKMSCEQVEMKTSDSVYEEWSLAETLNYEKEQLGFFVTGHPIDICKKLVESYRSYTVEGLKKEVIQYVDQYNEDCELEEITIAGVLSSFREVKTKKNELMGIGTIEDETGQIPWVIFPNSYIEILPESKEVDTIVLAKGTVTYTLEKKNIQIIIKQLLSANIYERKNTRSLILKMDQKEVTDEQVTLLKSVLEECKGKVKVYIKLTNEKGEEVSLKLNKSYSVKVSKKLKDNLHYLFKENQYEFVGREE